MPPRRPKPLATRLAAGLRGAREEKGWSQEEIADRAGLNARHYQKLEAGEVNVTLRTLERLGEAFEVDPINLF